MIVHDATVRYGTLLRISIGVRFGPDVYYFKLFHSYKNVHYFKKEIQVIVLMAMNCGTIIPKFCNKMVVYVRGKTLSNSSGKVHAVCTHTHTHTSWRKMCYILQHLLFITSNVIRHS